MNLNFKYNTYLVLVFEDRAEISFNLQILFFMELGADRQSVDKLMWELETSDNRTLFPLLAFQIKVGSELKLKYSRPV